MFYALGRCIVQVAMLGTQMSGFALLESADVVRLFCPAVHTPISDLPDHPGTE